MPRNMSIDPLKTALVKTTGLLLRTNGPDIDDKLGELLADVQRANMYGDGKTFVDLVPLRRASSIKEEYALVKQDPNFDLREFIARHFYDAREGVYEQRYVSNPLHTPLQHIDELWKFLERHNRVTRGSLLALPHPYIVPGGRFTEQFYWDSYFIMIGLASSNKWQRVKDMQDNFTYELRKFGYIPTANRRYLTSRSQPPFFSHMVCLLEHHKGKRALREYLPYLIMEYAFWMRGRSKVVGTEHRAYRRVVEMPDKTLLNRYYDTKTTPRPESYREDIETAQRSGRQDPIRLFLHIRAAAESGWDFSSRWFLDPADIHTIHTADIIPVDLNCLLYHLEITISRAYAASFNMVGARQFRTKARRRAAAITSYAWSEEQGYYMDYNFHHGTRTNTKTLAGVFPLYVGIASQAQADSVAEVLRKDFLRPGGLVTSFVENGQQWDAPNGWAPLHWVVIEGLRRYNHTELADEISRRWLALNERVYAQSGKFVEKYNVETDDGLGGGGEYVLQDGFGWTNGVYEALKRGFRP